MSEYSVCVVATHLEGEILETTSGSAVTFTTLAAKPVTEGGEFTGATPFSASVYTFVNPENQTTSCVFQYGPTLSYGKSVPCEPGTLEGAENQVAAGTLTDALSPGHRPADYRVVVTNPTGTTQGLNGTFSTPALQAPSIDSESASGVTTSGATLEGLVNPEYQETSYAFEYATNAALTGATSVPGASKLPPEGSDQPVSLVLSGSKQGRTYYYRIVAENETGPVDGTVQSFTTVTRPAVTTNAAEEITRTTAEASGTVDPAGALTHYHIAYTTQADYEAAVASGAANPYASGRVTPC